MEASPRIELGCKDLQSSASPLRHEASYAKPNSLGWRGIRTKAGAMQEALKRIVSIFDRA